MATRLDVFFIHIGLSMMRNAPEEEEEEGEEKKNEKMKKKKLETHVTVLALVAALKTFSAPCTAGSIRSSRSRPFSGFMMTGLAVWMSTVQPLRASSNEEGSVRSACFFCCFRGGGERKVPGESCKEALKKTKNAFFSLLPPLSLSLSLIAHCASP